MLRALILLAPHPTPLGDLMIERTQEGRARGARLRPGSRAQDSGRDEVEVRCDVPTQAVIV